MTNEAHVKQQSQNVVSSMLSVIVHSLMALSCQNLTYMKHQRWVSTHNLNMNIKLNTCKSNHVCESAGVQVKVCGYNFWPLCCYITSLSHTISSQKAVQC